MSFWQTQAGLYGITVKVHFFDPGSADDEKVAAYRVLPFLRAGAPAKLMFAEADRKNFATGDLIAQPDAVFEHRNGLISVEYKSVGRRPHQPDTWHREIRLKDMLQCLLGGYAVAQSYRRVTACVLRYHNVCYLLSPDPGIVLLMLDLIPMAKSYYGEDRRISASQLAEFSIARIQKIHPEPEDGRSAAGRAAHESMFRR